MRTLGVLSLVLLVVAPARAADGPTPWMHRDKLYDVAVVGDAAWIVGYPGVLLHTPDRGVTITSQAPAGLDEPLFAVDFVDPKTGWAVGRRGLVLHTADGGATWRRQASDTTEPLLAVDFADPLHGVAVGNFGVILRTEDGGATWTRALLDAADPEVDTVLNGVALVSASEGFLVGEFGTIARTTDGGKTWELQDSGMDRSLFAVAFRNPKEGVAVGSAGAALRTDDGGESWAEIPVESGRVPNLLSVAYGTKGLLSCGLQGLCVREGEKGLIGFRPGPFLWLSAVGFAADGALGFAVGRAGTLIVTTDGGATWAVIPTRR